MTTGLALYMRIPSGVPYWRQSSSYWAVRQVLAEEGRDPASFRIAKRIYIALDDEIERARKQMSNDLRRLYASFDIRNLLDVAVYGPPSACADGARAAVEAGAEMILFTPLSDYSNQMERLASEVMPRL